MTAGVAVAERERRLIGITLAPGEDLFMDGATEAPDVKSGRHGSWLAAGSGSAVRKWCETRSHHRLRDGLRGNQIWRHGQCGGALRPVADEQRRRIWTRRELTRPSDLLWTVEPGLRGTSAC